LEKLLCSSRWILSPLYMGLSVALIGVLIKFFQSIYHFISNIVSMTESEMVLEILTLIDISLVGNLVLIVLLSGYDNFVSQLRIVNDNEKLEWLGSHDYGALKMKVATSMIAISSIQILKIFMNIKDTPNDKIIFYIALHLTLVLSAFFMANINKIEKS